MPDKKIKCKDCNSTFVFTEREQQFYKEKGFQNEPQRCPDCRAANKNKSQGGNRGAGRRSEREMFAAVCAECGANTNVPFKPRDDRPVYCSDCYKKQSR